MYICKRCPHTKSVVGLALEVLGLRMIFRCYARNLFLLHLRNKKEHKQKKETEPSVTFYDMLSINDTEVLSMNAHPRTESGRIDGPRRSGHR